MNFDCRNFFLSDVLLILRFVLMELFVVHLFNGFLGHFVHPGKLRGLLLLLTDPVKVLGQVASLVLIHIDDRRSVNFTVVALALRRHGEVPYGGGSGGHSVDVTATGVTHHRLCVAAVEGARLELAI